MNAYGRHRSATIGLSAALCCLLGACSSSDNSDAPTEVATSLSGTVSDGVRPLAVPDSSNGLVFDSRINWVSGDVLVLPLESGVTLPADPKAFLLTGSQPSGSLAARVEFITVNVATAEHSAAEWLDAPGVWASGSAGTGTRVVVVEPAEAGTGDLVVGDRRYSVNWLPLPATLVRASPGAPEQPWESPLGTAVRQSPLFRALAERERVNPLTRWRYRLAFDGLNPASAESGQPFADRTIEAIARQNESRWRVALAWLWAADPGVALSLKRRLAASITLPDGAAVPAWPTSHVALDDLLSGLLDPTSTPSARARRAERWLADQPVATAWVVDDGGRLDADRRVIASVGIANLSEHATLGWAGLHDSEIEPEPVPLPAFTAIERLVAVAASDTGLAAVGLHAGEWSQIRGVIPGRIGVQPPGLDVVSLLGDWTMRDWLAGTPRSPASSWNTRCRLARNAGGYGWQLTVECDAAPAIGERSRERVFVRAGATSEEPAAIVAAPGMNTAAVRATDDASGWRATIDIPPEAVEADGTLRIAVSRVDARGRRSTWPRPMFPWQVEPARAALDLNRWEGLEPSAGRSPVPRKPGTTSGR